MSGRVFLCLLLSVFLVSGAVWSADEQIVYSGDFVSLGSMTKLCASASETGGAGFVGSPGVGLWLQAWDMSGNTRFPSPGGALSTNSLGNACILKTLVSGLYEVQALGATGAFQGLISMPAVVASLTPRSSDSAAATAGIGTANLLNGGREVALGTLLLDPRQGVQVTALPGGRSLVKFLNSRPLLTQFVLIDPDSPDGPTRIWAARSQVQLFVLASNDWQAQTCAQYKGFCDVEKGGSVCRGIMTAFARINNGWFRYNAAPITTLLVDGGGTLEIRVTTLSGQPLYDFAGSFRGSTGMYFSP